jgi:hypothetical protein
VMAARMSAPTKQPSVEDNCSACVEDHW